MYKSHKYKKVQKPKSLKGALKQVAELEGLLAIEEDAANAICELNNELILLQKAPADKIEREYLPQSLFERLTEKKRETEESKRNYEKWLLRQEVRDKKMFEILKKYFFRIAASSLHGNLGNQHSPESLKFENGDDLAYSKAPRYCNRGYRIETGGPYIEGIISGLRIRLENAKSNLSRLERRAASNAVKKAQVATAIGTSRNLAATVKNHLPTDHPCPYCGVDLGMNYHADHIYPVSKGGQSRAENMVNVCAQCNSKKSDLTLSTFIEQNGLDRVRIERNLNSLGKEF